MKLETLRPSMGLVVSVTKSTGAVYTGVLARLSPGRNKFLLVDCCGTGGQWLGKHRSNRWFDPGKFVSLTVVEENRT